jgi:multiple sugar transport system permease protein
MRGKALSESATAAWMIFPALAFVLVFALYPAANSIYLSLHEIVLGLPGLGEPYVGLENYRVLLQDPVAGNAFLVTLMFVLISTLLELGIGLVLALVLHEQFRGRGWVRATVLIPWAIPTVVASQMWRFIFNDQYGLINLILFGEEVSRYIPWLAHPVFAFSAIVLADVWKTASFAALLILAGLQVIPDELYDAARIDGANAWHRFWRITFPLLRPALLVALLFRTMDAFKVFDLVFVMTQGGPADATQVLQYYGYKTMFTEGMLGYGSTISVSVFLTVFILSLIYIRVIGTRLFSREAA